MYNGIINVYKEPGYTSHDVVARLRGILHQKKIGHAGTLDPDAEGVLPVCLGAATRICELLADDTKEYMARMQLGVTTDTQDMSGRILEERSCEGLDEETIRKTVLSFTGDITQVPPMYSALKVNGKKLYELARAGVEVERKPRHIRIHEIEITDICIPEISFRTVCSKGTYIRTLCDDIGRSLGCGGTLKHLIRTRVGKLEAGEALKLETIESKAVNHELDEFVIPVGDYFDELGILYVNESGAKKASNGNMLNESDVTQGFIGLHNNNSVKVMGENSFLYGIYRFESDRKVLSPVKMFFC